MRNGFQASKRARGYGVVKRDRGFFAAVPSLTPTTVGSLVCFSSEHTRTRESHVSLKDSRRHRRRRVAYADLKLGVGTLRLRLVRGRDSSVPVPAHCGEGSHQCAQEALRRALLARRGASMGAHHHGPRRRLRNCQQGAVGRSPLLHRQLLPGNVPLGGGRRVGVAPLCRLEPRGGAMCERRAARHAQRHLQSLDLPPARARQ